MIIREATKDDAKTLSDLSIKTYIDAFGPPFEAESDMEKWIRETRSEDYFISRIEAGLVLVAEDKSQIVGYAEFGEVGPSYPIDNKEAGDQQISRLFVLAGHQGQGIGKALLNKILGYDALREAKNIYLDVQLENTGAQKLYGSYGFVMTDRVVDGDAIMVKRQLLH